MVPLRVGGNFQGSMKNASLVFAFWDKCVTDFCLLGQGLARSERIFKEKLAVCKH
jgi:hypothetical protein